uniref:Uncharacterized protein n=1 Tax=Tanacetum cinerariifolium TaxID=118510 RepID=A0A6L2KT02_TANCI|nr:hypothetical protein [Tanacetum cinerariifolium]
MFKKKKANDEAKRREEEEAAAKAIEDEEEEDNEDADATVIAVKVHTYIISSKSRQIRNRSSLSKDMSHGLPGASKLPGRIWGQGHVGGVREVGEYFGVDEV